MKCIVTGASRGIGFEVCKLMLSKSCRVVALSRNKEGLEKLKAFAASQGLDDALLVLPTDISDGNSLADSVKKFTLFLDGELNILINNAGYLQNKPLMELSETDFDRIYKTNVWAPFHLIQQTISLFKKADFGHILNISSVGGVQGSLKFPGLSLYSSSKGALNVLSECVAEELKETNIKCNTLALGAVQTEMLEEAFPGYQTPISAQDMAKYVVHFALKDHQFMNGKIISVSSSNP